MSVSIKTSNQTTASRSTPIRATAAPSIKGIFSAGQSSVRSSSTMAQTSATASAEYLSSATFMRDLKVKLSTAGDDPAQYLRARSMMSALQGGRLQVDDPTQGKSIKAWDPGQKNAKPTAATDIAKTNWVNFLNSELKRSEDGTLSKDGSGSYVDKASGKNAYFGRVAGKYYYVTWPAETKA